MGIPAFVPLSIFLYILHVDCVCDFIVQDPNIFSLLFPIDSTCFISAVYITRYRIEQLTHRVSMRDGLAPG